MKRIVTLTLTLLLIFMFSGCTSRIRDTSESSKSGADNYPSQPAPTNSDTKLEIDGYRLSKGQIAASDENGDFYYISHTGVNKIAHDTGDMTKLTGDFTFGKCLSLHNQWVYYLRGGTLCRVKKSGEDNFDYPLQFANGIGSIYICGNKLFITTYSDENKLEYYYSDISDDPETLISTPGANGFDFDAFARKPKDYEALISSKANELQISLPVQLIEKSENYLYFYSTKREFGRIDLKTQEVEVLSISPYQFEKVTIVSNWIFYNDNDGAILRTTEDLTQTEKLT